MGVRDNSIRLCSRGGGGELNKKKMIDVIEKGNKKITRQVAVLFKPGQLVGTAWRTLNYYL